MFDTDKILLNYQPKNGGWTVTQILEHIVLTNHFLLILIRKGTVKAIEKAKTTNLTTELTDYNLGWDKLEAIGQHQSFEWNRPEHMEPTGTLTLAEVKIKLSAQLEECLDLLSQMPNGEGVLYKTTMSVNSLGKIDVYHYIYFLRQHAERHLKQMEKIKNERN